MPSTRQTRSARTLASLLRRFGLAALIGGSCHCVQAVTLSWDDAGNSASKLWSDNGNWSPDAAVQTNDDIIIGNLANAAGDQTLYDITTQIASLTISNGSGVINSTDSGATAPNTRELIVNGATTISGAGSGLIIYGRGGDGFDTNTLTVNSGATVTLNSQAGIGTAVVEVDSGLFDINTGGTLIGNGRLDLEEIGAGVPFTVLQNDGVITAGNLGLTLLAPPARTLQITATDADARFDWDGAGSGVLNVNGNATLDVDVSTGTDAFSGTMNLATGATLDMGHAWSLDTGTINANTPAFGLILPGSDPLPGPAARIVGADWTMTGGTVNVDDAWDSLTLVSNLNATGGVFNVAGTLQIDGAATFGAGADLAATGASADLIVNGSATVSQTTFNWDGFATTTVNDGASLTIGSTSIDTAADGFDATLNINGGTVTVTSAWAFEVATLNLDTSNSDSDLSGGVITLNNSSATINVVGTGAAQADINATLVIDAAVDFNIAPGATLNLATNTVNVVGTTWDGGAGSILRNGSATINAITTYNLPGGTVDLDDGADTLNAQLTINADSIDDAGDGYDGTLTINNTGTLLVNLTGALPWEMDGVLNYNGDATSGTIVGGTSPVHFTGGSTLNVTGEGAITSRAIFAGVVNLNSAGEDLELFGGDQTEAGANYLQGATVNGPGQLAIDGGQALRGFGVVNAEVRGDFNAELIADGGTLSLTGGIADIGTIGTSGALSVLNVSSSWNTSVADVVRLSRGALIGASIINDNLAGIQGQGLVAAPVQNNQLLISNSGGTLLFNNSLNDWDGAGGTGTLWASNGTLELQDNAPFLFTGVVRADAGSTVFANGFELEFDPGSTLRLAGGAYRSTHATDIGGAVDVTGAGSTIAVSGTVVFENGSNTTLNGDLHLENHATRIAPSATFGGGGELVNGGASNLAFDDGAVVGVQVTNRGAVGIAGIGTGRADVGDYLQESTGSLSIDVDGTALGQFDRLVVNGIAQLDGDLQIATGGFGPTLGATVQVLTATGGVLGSFANLIDMTGNLPAGTQWEAVYNANSVQLTLGLVLPGDFNNDGLVDAADYTVYRDNLGMAITLPGDPTPGAVTADDHAVWAANYGAMAPAPSMAFAMAAAVPEPTTGALVVLAAAGLAGARRRS